MSAHWVSGEDLWHWRQSVQQRTMGWGASPPTQSEYLRELDWILTAIADIDRLALRLETYRNRPEIELQQSLVSLSALWERRLQEQVPVQYLLGKTAWRDLMLIVEPGVLIPRPETELLIDLAQAAVLTTQAAPEHWVDLGTGSGAIALALAQSFPNAEIHAVDCSAVALNIARRNAQQLGWDLTKRVSFYQGSWLEPLAHLKNSLTGIVSNPPYISSAVVPTLQPEVVDHEPHLALDGGEDGLDAIRVIIQQAPQYLRPQGVLLLEMMMGQAKAVVNLLDAQGDYCKIQIHSDLAGIERFAQAYRI